MEGDGGCFLALRADALGVATDGPGDAVKGGCEGVRPGETPSNGGRDGRAGCDGVHGEQTDGSDSCC